MGLVGCLEGHGGRWRAGLNLAGSLGSARKLTPPRDSYIFPGTFPSEKGILSWYRPMVGRLDTRYQYGESSHISAGTVEAVLWEFCSWALDLECS